MNSVIQLTSVGKRYLLEYRKKISLKELFLNLYKGIPRYNELWALKEINLDVPKGQALGVIGKNGSGKTTLLKLICRVTEPTRGFIKVNGKIAALLELNTGFQDDLTGRENIYLNGSILGMPKKEIQKNINSIIDFADIWEFIDTPVRTYSTGMYLRLGFAIAAQLTLDILLIDEMLTVGDLAFQKKCFEKIQKFKEAGKTIVFISHNLSIIKQLCERVILMDKGSIVCDGEPEEAISRYFSIIDKKETGWPTKEIEIVDVYFKNNKGDVISTFKTGEEMRIVIEYFAHKRIENPIFGVGIYKDGIYLIGPNTRDDDYVIDYVESNGSIEYAIGQIPFSEGRYKVSVSIHNVDETRFYDYHDSFYGFQVALGKKRFKYGLITVKDALWSEIK